MALRHTSHFRELPLGQSFPAPCPPQRHTERIFPITRKSLDNSHGLGGLAEPQAIGCFTQCDNLVQRANEARFFVFLTKPFFGAFCHN
jgi:hypothetical protein